MATTVGVIAVRVKPGARHPRVGGRYDGPLGPALLVAVNAPAVDGRATEAAIRAVAQALGLRRSALSLRRGESSRDKLLQVDDAPADLDEIVRTVRDGAATGRP